LDSWIPLVDLDVLPSEILPRTGKTTISNINLFCKKNIIIIIIIINNNNNNNNNILQLPAVAFFEWPVRKKNNAFLGGITAARCSEQLGGEWKG